MLWDGFADKVLSMCVYPDTLTIKMRDNGQLANCVVFVALGKRGGDFIMTIFVLRARASIQTLRAAETGNRLASWIKTLPDDSAYHHCPANLCPPGKLPGFRCDLDFFAFLNEGRNAHLHACLQLDGFSSTAA